MQTSPARQATAGHRNPLRRERVKRMMRIVGLACVGALSVALITAVISSVTTSAAPATVRVKSYYLALGTSLAYGQQAPDFNHGYPQQWFTLLQSRGSRSLTNYGCPGETSTQMIHTINCAWVNPYDPSHPTLSSHDPYNNKTELDAALAFIAAHPHQVSPVSLDMGANDLLPDITVTPTPTGFTCTWDPTKVRNDEATLDANLQQTILPQLVQALQNHGSQMTGDLVMMNYYDPFQNIVQRRYPLFRVSTPTSPTMRQMSLASITSASVSPTCSRHSAAQRFPI